MKKIYKYCSYALIVASTSFISPVLADNTISNIIVKGNKRVEKETIINYLNVGKGEKFSIEKQDSAIKSLYATSLFENIEINFQDGNLIVAVKENPFVNKVTIKGNSKISSDIIKKELANRSGESLSAANVKFDIDKIKELYKRKGRFSIDIASKIEPLENNRVNLVYEIKEGPKTSIKKIYFVGNENYRDGELKSVILTKESAWFRFMSSDDAYDPDRMEYDKDLLREFYTSVGFADFRVISATAELSQAKDHFNIVYSIEEGEKYDFGDIKIHNRLSEIDNKLLEKYIDIKSGQTYNSRALENIAEKLSYELATHGYPQVEVVPNEKKNYSNKTVDVEFVVREATKVYLNKINIHGNVKTREKVIRREFKIAEGDLFNQAQVERSEQRLRNLDYFETVRVALKPTTQADKRDLDVEVADKSTSSIGLQLGYNSLSGLFTSIDFNEKNLVGTGRELDLGINRTKTRTSLYAGITDPYFMDRDILVGFNAFTNFTNKSRGKSSKDEQPYNITTTGGGPRIAYDISEYLRHNIDYTLKKEKVKGVSERSSFHIREQEGSTVTSSIGHTLTYDKTDSRIIPKNGYLISGSQEIAGVGGDTKFLKHEIEGKYFKSFFNNKVTFKIKAEAGNIKGWGGSAVKIQDRFNVGDYNLRGFAGSGIGPRDKKTDEAIGGQNYYTGTAEVTFPLGLPKEFDVQGAAFLDVGALWSYDMSKAKKDQAHLYSKNDIYDSKMPRASYGFGFIWITKLAPIEVFFGFPFKKTYYDKKQRVHFRFAARL
ncbi:MAG: bamA [Rickettsiaceae bacterium]|nr:bamA [Rickettsiaceae bacterium]